MAIGRREFVTLLGGGAAATLLGVEIVRVDVAGEHEFDKALEGLREKQN